MTQSMRILIVDDEEPIREALGAWLIKDGYKVNTADSGQTALACIEKGFFDLYLVDIKMPGMGGIETLTEIQRKYPLVEVIMLSGHVDVAAAIEGMKQGAFDYLMKPVEMDQIIAKVTEAVSKKRQHEEKIIQARINEITSRRA